MSIKFEDYDVRKIISEQREMGKEGKLHFFISFSSPSALLLSRPHTKFFPWNYPINVFHKALHQCPKDFSFTISIPRLSLHSVFYKVLFIVHLSKGN